MENNFELEVGRRVSMVYGKGRRNNGIIYMTENTCPDDTTVPQ